MTEKLTTLAAVVGAVKDAPRREKHRMIAVCGAPASGKSTLAEALCDALKSEGINACLVPMDGFHLDNTILAASGTLDRKGAPHTFDSAGFASLIGRCAKEDDVYYPTFDRTRDISIAASGMVSRDTDTVVVEGNYLLMQTPGWRDLDDIWDMSIYLEVSADTLKERLVKRWTDHGLSHADADARAEHNDMPNARTVIEQSAPADLIYSD